MLDRDSNSVANSMFHIDGSFGTHLDKAALDEASNARKGLDYAVCPAARRITYIWLRLVVHERQSPAH
jgi:hypothetical protein